MYILVPSIELMAYKSTCVTIERLIPESGAISSYAPDMIVTNRDISCYKLPAFRVIDYTYMLAFDDITE